MESYHCDEFVSICQRENDNYWPFWELVEHGHGLIVRQVTGHYSNPIESAAPVTFDERENCPKNWVLI